MQAKKKKEKGKRGRSKRGRDKLDPNWHQVGISFVNF